MTITDVIEMARKAGGYDGFTSPPTDWGEDNFVISPEGLLKFAILVRNATLEEAAEEADRWQTALHDPRYECDCATAIRAMKEQFGDDTCAT